MSKYELLDLDSLKSIHAQAGEQLAMIEEGHSEGDMAFNSEGRLCEVMTESDLNDAYNDIGKVIEEREELIESVETNITSECQEGDTTSLYELISLLADVHHNRVLLKNYLPN